VPSGSRDDEFESVAEELRCSRTPPHPAASRRTGGQALRTLGATAAAGVRTALETLVATGFDDFGTGYGPGTCLVLSTPAGTAR
jgi:hypothetical protein